MYKSGKTEKTKLSDIKLVDASKLSVKVRYIVLGYGEYHFVGEIAA